MSHFDPKHQRTLLTVIENGFGLAAQKLIELAHALFVQTDDFSIEDRIFDGKFSKDCSKRWKPKGALTPRYKAAFSALNIGNAPLVRFWEAYGIRCAQLYNLAGPV